MSETPALNDVAPPKQDRTLEKRFAVLAVIVVALLIIPWAISAIRPSTEKDLTAAYARLDTALKTRNLPAYMELLAPDYTELRLNGKPMDRRKAEANYRQMMEDWTALTVQPIEIDSLKTKGDNATVILKMFANTGRQSSRRVLQASAFPRPQSRCAGHTRCRSHPYRFEPDHCRWRWAAGRRR